MAESHVCIVQLHHELRPHALFEAADVLRKDPAAELIYFDEDMADAHGEYVNPYFKPDWSPDLLLSQMYIGNCFVAHRSGMVGAMATQEAPRLLWGAVLKLTERGGSVYHIPQVLFSSTSRAAVAPEDVENQKTMLERTLQRRNITARVEPVARNPGHHRIHWTCVQQPAASIIICTRDKASMLTRCLDSIFARTRYNDFEVIVVDNNSSEPATRALFDKWLAREPARFRVHAMPTPFNYSALNNEGARLARGELLVLLNNDTEVIAPAWMADMAAHAQRSDIGAVGAMLLYPNNTIQHAGVIARIGAWCGHGHQRFPANSPGYHGRLLSVAEYSAVTGACLMVRRELFGRVGGLNENLPVTCNDIEFCWRLLASGYRNVLVPTARLYHYESATRGYSNSPEQKARDAREMAYTRNLWPKYWASDPYYNINLTHAGTDFALPES
jgi:GT2 family glycosyltransferase